MISNNLVFICVNIMQKSKENIIHLLAAQLNLDLVLTDSISWKCSGNNNFVNITLVRLVCKSGSRD